MYNFHTILFVFYIIIHFGISQELSTQNNIFEFNQGTKLHMKVYDLQRHDYEKCGDPGQYETKCERQGNSTLELTCEIVNYKQGDKVSQYINASTKATVSAEHAGIWQCTFALIYTENRKPKNENNNIQATFKLSSIIKEEENSSIQIWAYVGGSIGVLALIVIVTQTGCILYFKRKARGRKRMESLQSSATVDSPDNAVRYTKMPGQIKMEQSNVESRESVIYEVLENFNIPKPVPPPIDSLPGVGKTTNESQKSSKTLPLPTAKKPVKTNKNIDKCKDNTMSISSLKRIKSRKPQPLPTEEPTMYEVMTPPGTLKKPESGLRRTLPGKAHLPTQAVPIFPTGNNVPVLPSMIAATQLKPVPSHKPKMPPIPEPKKPAPFALKKTHEGFRPAPGALPVQPSPPLFRKPPETVPVQPSAPVFRKPPVPLPIQPLPVNNGSISSDEEEWTYEPLSQYNQYNIYDNVPR